MPSFSPLTLTVESVGYVYKPSSNKNGKGILVDRDTQTRVVDQSVITAEASAPTATTGSQTKTVFKLPIPVADQTGCCVDKNSPMAIFINTDIKVPNVAQATNRNLALALYREYVKSADFAALFMGESYFS